MKLSRKLNTFFSEKEQNKAFEKCTTSLPKQDRNLYNGELVSNIYGEHLLLKQEYELDFVHGGESILDVSNFLPEIIEIMGKSSDFKDWDFSSTVFIDTETTGLAGGSGTYAFLIGAGYFSCDKFIVRQYFMRDFDEEQAILSSFAKFFKHFKSITSFNGKAYDIPLIRTRYLMNRMENPIKDMLHMDLLSCARRFYRERLDSVSLSSLEKNIFCLNRVGDVPGHEIPSIYFEYLRDKDQSRMKPILYHNRMDILSLVTLFIKMARAVENPFCSDSCKDQDYFCLAKSYEDMGEFKKSIKCYKKALEIPGVKARAYRRLSLLYKRLEHWNEAEKLWENMVGQNLYPVFALIELAKYYEHKKRDYQMAIEVVERAIEIEYRKKFLLGDCQKNQMPELNKRIARITSKLKKTK